MKFGRFQLGNQWLRRFARVYERRKAAGEEGSAIVEFAVTLPLLMLIMTGIFSYTIALYQNLQLGNAVAMGGRTLSVDRGDTDPCATATAAVRNAAPGLIGANITFTFILNGAKTNGTSCPGSGGAANANMVSGQNAQISVTYPCALMVYGATFSTCTLGSSVTEVVQ